MSESTGEITTINGSKYLQQLCKHWSHSLDVDFGPMQGSVTFPAIMRDKVFPGPGRATMTADPMALHIALEATTAEQIELLKLVVMAHLDRFAFREAPLAVEWSDAGQAVEV